MNDTIETLGDRIRELRYEIDMQQKDLAEITGIPVTVLSRYENNKRIPGFVNMQKIMRALGVTSEHFEGFETRIENAKAQESVKI